MPKLIRIEEHLTLEELEQRYRNAREVTEKIHYQTIWLLATGRTSSEVSEITGYSRNWIYRLVRRYNAQGTEGLGCLLYTSPSPRDSRRSRMPSSA